jgi:hypothetical protein
MAIPAAAQSGACNLGMTLNCPNGNCTAVTVNNGSGTCSGEYLIGIELVGGGTGTVSALQQTLGAGSCFSSADFPSIPVPLALCIIDSASLAPGASFTMNAAVNVPGGGTLSNVAAVTIVIDPNSGEELAVAYVFNNGGPTPSCTPIASVPSAVQSGVSYNVTWLPVTELNATYIVEESTDANFTAISGSQTTSGLSATFTHSAGSNTTYYYRVHAVTCSGAPGPNSSTVSVVVQAIPTVTGRQGDVTTPVGSTTPVSMKVFIPGPVSKNKQAQDVGFTATTDKPYLTVSPSSGTIGPNGTTVTVTANPSNLPPGANTGTLTVTANGSTLASKSVSVSLVTPVSPAGKGLPPPNALIIPAVAHAPGAFGPFQSDVRLTNAGNAQTTYQVTYTPTRRDATQNSKSTTISVDAGQTIALNDILRDFFGVGATDDPNDNGQGTLEIRPLNSASTLNYASSRLFTFNSNGTFGQFVAAIPYSAFATKTSITPPLPGVPPPTGTPTLSLQQISCCSGPFRTNLGLVEGSGTPASGNINLYDDRGTLLKSVPYSLLPGEHHQESFAGWGLPEVSDGRIQVTVESTTGAVTAYASVLDNRTNDPLEVTPVQVSSVSATRYIQPGMAALVANGPNNFHSDVRIFNGGTTAATVTPTFYSFIGNPPKTLSAFTINPGEVKTFDDVVTTLFNSTGDGGSIVFTTTAPSSLVTTGRTYTIDTTQNNGTFGQFIPGVTSTQGIAAGDKPLQILQLEESTNFRANVGVAELTGNPAHVRLTAFIPDSKTEASTEFDLAPNQFMQLPRPLAAMYPGQNIYNARISVAVTGGTGRVAAYGSVIDNKSLDPTYVPAQQSGQ